MLKRNIVDLSEQFGTDRAATMVQTFITELHGRRHDVWVFKLSITNLSSSLVCIQTIEPPIFCKRQGVRPRKFRHVACNGSVSGSQLV